MILECPNCSARFLLSSEALGTEGREVRCGKCAHSWFQQPDRDSLDELSRTDRETHPAETQSQPHKDFDSSERDPEIASLIETAINQKDTVKVDFMDDAPAPKMNEKVKNDKGRKRHVMAVFAALALTALLISAYALLYNSLGKSSAFMGASYAKLGLAPEPDKPKVAFDRMKLSRNGQTITGTGYLINLTSEDIALNKIKLELIDMDYKTLKSSEIKLPENLLKSESSEKIDFVFSDAPREAVSVRASVTQ